MEINILNKCRACLTEKTVMLPLFDTYENDLTLADIIQHFLNTQLSLYDNLPKRICEECATYLIQFYNFSVVFAESNIKLANLIENNQPLFENKNFQSTDFEISSEIEEIKISNKYELDVACAEIAEENKLCNLVSCNNNEVVVKVENDDNYEEIVIRTTDETTSVSGNDRYKCPICNKNFPNLLLLRKHLQLHINNKKFICEVCGYTTMKKSYLSDHMQTHSLNRLFKCNICSKSFRCRSAFSRHKRIHTNPKQIVCEMCGQKFTDRGTLKTHVLLLHSKIRDFKCIICNQSFPLKATLMKHLRRHQQKEGAAKKNFKCTECNMQYFDKSSLKRHCFTKHSSEYVKFKCQVCYKEYTTKASLEKHSSVHHKS
ncbi:zinc finger protein [Holotrichia oblita]|uniref:Zinc finger protein n=1 Tax=Holotrichia oblita TaxID=644536 RepID=A0ACB9T1W1_HOLOL|nr:zinc finger protein [Holotrichia oblita]